MSELPYPPDWPLGYDIVKRVVEETRPKPKRVRRREAKLSKRRLSLKQTPINTTKETA